MQTRNLILGAVALTVGLAACSSTDNAGDPAVTPTGSAADSVTPDSAGDTADTGDTSGTTEGSDMDAEDPAVVAGETVAVDVDVFDASVLHTIAVEFEQDDYDAMIGAYEDTGDKEWIEATVTIDGTIFERAGLRLKGNSSLAGLGGAGGMGGFPGRVPAGDATDASSDSDAAVPAGPGGGGMAEFGDASADEPENLPWLIGLDEFVDDQSYQGYEDFVVRSNNTETAMNEALTLALLAESGLASQDAIATRFSVNGGDDVLRLVIEHPDDDEWYETSFESDGALYKAESTGDWTYRGDDPESYDEIFDQEGGSDVADLTPLIEFLDFINNSDDATFAAELTDRLDVDAFATYLAMMELVGNSDDIDGPGNNAYLWWDADSGQFTIVPWDMNLTLGSEIGFGGGQGGFPGGQGGFPGAAGGPPTEVVAGGTLPDGTEFPGDVGGPGGNPPGGGDGPTGGGFGGRSNPLVERFLANTDFNALYETRLAELTEQLITSGVAESVLATWVELLHTQATDLADWDTVEAEATHIREFLANTSAD